MATATKRRRRTFSEKLEAEVRRQMNRRFKKFKVKELMRSGVYRSWYCAEPGCWDCSFTITTIPGRLIMTGDLGTLVVERTFDMLPWCRGSCDSTSYFAEKVTREIPTTEFSRDRVEEWINEEIKDIKLRKREGDTYDRDEANLELLTETLEWGLDDHGEEHFAEELRPIWEGNDYPRWSSWKRQFLIQRDAIRWFVRHHTEPAIEQPTAR